MKAFTSAFTIAFLLTFSIANATLTCGGGNDTTGDLVQEQPAVNITNPPEAAAPTTKPAAGATNAAHGGPPFDPAGAKNVGNGKGAQFITGQCLNAADCGSGCCAGPAGICSGVGAQFQAGKTGCGFVSKKKLLRV